MNWLTAIEPSDGSAVEETAKLALEALRRYALLRVSEKKPVSFVHNGDVLRVDSRDDKYEGAWKVFCQRFEHYVGREELERMLRTAEMIGVGDYV